MRFWIIVLAAAALTTAAVAVALLFLNNAVYIEYLGWSMEAPLWLAVISFALATSALGATARLLWWLLTLPKRLARWRGEKRRQKHAELMRDTLRLAVYNDYPALLKTLAALAETDAAAAWEAARIAAAAGKGGDGDKFLRLAAAGGDANIAAAAKAELCRRDNRPTEADNVLRAANALSGPVFLAEAYYRLSQDRDDARAMLKSARRLRDKAGAQWRDAVDDAMRRAFAQCKNADDAAAFWKDDVAGEDKKRADTLADYLTTLTRLGDAKRVKELLTPALKQHARHERILEIAVAAGDKSQRETAYKANESRAADNDENILRLLAELAEGLELPGQARRYYQMLNALAPHPRYQKALAALAAADGGGA